MPSFGAKARLCTARRGGQARILQSPAGNPARLSPRCTAGTGLYRRPQRLLPPQHSARVRLTAAPSSAGGWLRRWARVGPIETQRLEQSLVHLHHHHHHLLRLLLPNLLLPHLLLGQPPARSATPLRRRMMQDEASASSLSSLGSSRSPRPSEGEDNRGSPNIALEASRPRSGRR